ncbi:hypothetical protein GJ744_010676 [Endocarpon pusillum]|uniref:Bromodomain-containing protein n=1 Tax=Endocarpon pusillum TaxID=364733 RepID=A0A8H7AFX8_9EURO|nr:hypothetical protein GJ744_010676 [Endocarpon pusillum]
MEVSMEFSRRPEELAKAEGLSDRPPTPEPEKQLERYETHNVGAVASNAEDVQTPLPSKPAFSVATPPALDNLTEMPLQPVQEIMTDAEPQTDRPVHPSTMDDTPHQNGRADDAFPTANGAPSPQINGNLTSPPPSNPPQTESTTTDITLIASSSSLPASTSFDSFAPSTTQVGTQNSATTATPQDPIESVSEVRPAPEQAPTSDMRSSPQPLPQESETAPQIENEKDQQDLANDPELAQGLAAGGNGPIERTNSPQPASIPVEEQNAFTSDMDISFDAAGLQPVTMNPPTVTDIALPSPPPPPEPAHATLPADQPLAPAPASAAPESSSHLQVDRPMPDAPPSPGKISRDRDEEDDEAGPAAKRLKSEVAEPEFKVPEAPVRHSPADQRATEQSPPADDLVTPARLGHMKKVIANLKKSAISQYFREPVNPVALQIPTYFDIIKKPMDLGTMDRKLKGSKYQSVSAFVADFNLIVDNTALFNGPNHNVTESGVKMRQSFNNQMKQLPRADFVVPVKEEKKSAKTKEHPVRTASQRRPSTSQASIASTARSPATPVSGTTFALNPQGIPLIRRDSTVGDGRPKRAIHPPKHRDQEFGPGRPRKKKFEWQLKFCREVINEMKKPKYYSFAQFFYLPVDPVALNIPNYHSVVKKPMDLDTVERKLENNQYERARDFEEDIRQIFKNCFLFNAPGEFVHTAGQQLEKVFEDKWSTKDEWLASHEPASEPQSAGEEDEEDEASEDDDDDDSNDERTDEIAQLKAQIAMMSQTIGNLQSAPKKKKKATPPAPAASKKSGKPKKKDKPTNFPAPQQTGKDKKKGAAKSKQEKEHFVTYNEKQYISTGISSLPDARMSEALKIIQSNVPSLKNTHETEIELDIDELPNHVLLKLLSFVKKYGEHAPPEPEPPQQPSYAPPMSATGKPKKNKPMSKQEQEQQIRELKGKLGVYDGGQTSPDPNRSVENAVESSDEDSEESEEE